MRKLVKALFIIVITSTVTIAAIKRNSVQRINLTLENIEAFAEAEKDNNCYGEGSIDCPDGSKCEWISGYQRLWLD